MSMEKHVPSVVLQETPTAPGMVHLAHVTFPLLRDVLGDKTSEMEIPSLTAQTCSIMITQVVRPWRKRLFME